MAWSFPIARLFGSELRVHATFFLILIWIGIVGYGAGGMPAAIENVIFILALFACVVAHEFGHALTARRYGIRTPDITLLPIGGLARLERMPENPRQEITVALAGPAVNIVIWAVLMLALGGRMPQVDDMLLSGGTLEGFLARLAGLNLFLALFNLLPAFPMDGGRVLRAALSARMDRVRATQIAAGAGRVLAFGMGFLGLLSGNPMLMLIGVFIFIAAGAEAQDVSLRALSRRLRVRDAMITSYEALRPEDTLQAAGQALIRTTQHEFPVLDQDDRPVGLLTRNTIFAALGDPAAQLTSLSAVQLDPLPCLAPHLPLTDVLDLMHADQAGAVAICTAEGRALGYVTRENLGELMILHSRDPG
ncbi:site-2 protease family protein [Seohaeicola saemankumensis]|uniref:Zinc metalloprotease n=1 Tax=Seohaeicola saemankumensis TaxID=481181 RepID=A0ABW3TGA7_9RHOB